MDPDVKITSAEPADGASGGCPEAPGERLKVLALAALLLAAHGALAVDSLRQKSVTFDEITHLPAGLDMVATGEHRLNRQHPPLVKLLAGLSASTAHPSLPLAGAAYREGREWDFGVEVLFESGNDERQLLFRGRLPTVALSLLGGVVIFAWGVQRFGAAAGLLSLGLYAFSPTVLAHARLVTMDVAVATFSTATLYFAWRAGRDPTARNVLATGASLGLAIATKFSGLVLLPAVLLPALLAHGLRGAWRKRLAAGAAVVAVAFGVLAAAYLWPRNAMTYFSDLGLLYYDLPDDYAFYLAGDFSRQRFPHYFLVATAVKSTLLTLLAMLAGLVYACWSRREWRDDLYLWLPAAIWTAATSAMASNQGIRYMLPVYSLLFILAGGAAAALARTAGPRIAAALVAAMVIAQASEVVAHHPDYIPYFHPLAGGVEAGPRWLDDSNVDWGEDLGRLPVWLADRGIERVRVASFGYNDPKLYGIALEPILMSDWRERPRRGAYVVSSHVLVRWLLDARTHGTAGDWLDRYEPVDVLGGSLYLYVFPAVPADGPLGEEAER